MGTTPIVDIGAYEVTVQQSIICEPSALTVPEGSSVTFSVRLALEPQNPVFITVAKASGDTDLSIAAGTVLIFDSMNYSISQSVTTLAAEDADHFESQAVFSIQANGLSQAVLTATEKENDPYPNTLLVDRRAPGANNGSSWVDAYRDLQDALAVARITPEVREIWVAKGTCRPHNRPGIVTNHLNSLTMLFFEVGGPDGGQAIPMPGMLSLMKRS